MPETGTAPRAVQLGHGRARKPTSPPGGMLCSSGSHCTLSTRPKNSMPGPRADTQLSTASWAGAVQQYSSTAVWKYTILLYSGSTLTLPGLGRHHPCGPHWCRRAACGRRAAGQHAPATQGRCHWQHHTPRPAGVKGRQAGGWRSRQGGRRAGRYALNQSSRRAVRQTG